MSQFGFVGPAYTAANPFQDNQALINWFIEADPNEPNPQSPDVVTPEAKAALGLLGVPGLVALNSSKSGSVRGMYVLPGGQSALVVIASSVYTTTNGSDLTLVGTIGSNSGPVNIRSSGTGNVAVIVDGTSNLGVYKSGAVSLFTNNYLGATNVAEIDGWFIFNQPGTQKFFTSPAYWDGSANFDGTYYALADNAPGKLVTLIETNRELWLLCEDHVEPWYNAGGATFPFSRIDGAMIQIGCAAAQSVARTGKGLIWLAQSERGANSVVMSGRGYSYDVISTPAISYALNQYSKVSDAIGYTYTDEGHEFYVLILPTADVTWVYDLTTGFWHQRASFDPATGLFHRQRANCYMSLAGKRIVGDYTNGRIYQQTRAAYADDQYPLVALRRTPHVWDKADRNRVRHSRLQVEFFPGSGIATGQGNNPQAMLRFSNDGGQTWGNEHWASIGQSGQTKSRVIWRRLGMARDRVYEVRVTDPVRRDVVGASLMADGTGA